LKNLKIVVVFLVVILVGVYTFLSSSSKTLKDMQPHKPVVAVTTFALYDVVKHIGAKSIEIVNIIPFGVDPHSFEPTPKLMAKIERADLIFYSGAGLEPWVHGFVFQNKAIDVSKYVNLRHLGKNEFEYHEHHDEQCAHSDIDPHYWLDFDNMKKITHLVADELTALQPKYESLYRQNEDKYIHMLQKLDKAYKKHLSACRIDTVVASHNALGYLAQQYHFKVDSLTGLSPESQPSAKDITRIMNNIKRDGVSTIFFEHFVNDSVIKSIAKDTKIHIDVFQPLGNITADEAKAGLTYEDFMYQNLEKLTKALLCN